MGVKEQSNVWQNVNQPVPGSNKNNMQLYALTRENTRRTGEHYWNLQKLNTIEELPKVGESLNTANWTITMAMQAYDILHEDGGIDFAQPYRIIVQAEGMTHFTMACEGDWAITILMYD